MLIILVFLTFYIFQFEFFFIYLHGTMKNNDMEHRISTELKQLRCRFVSDLNLPFNLISSPWFEERLSLAEIEYGAETSYNELWTLIIDRFNGSISDFLNYYYKVRDDIITTVTNSEAYNDFISNDKFVKNFELICPNRNLYTNEQDGCMFISYDMKKANFQVLKYANKEIVLNADTYEDFIGLFTDLDYIKKSKYTRQVIFGKMNPKRVMNLEKWITNEFAKHLLNDNTFNDKLSLFSLNADEIIFKFNGTEDEFNDLTLEKICIYDGIEYRLNKFKLHARHFKFATSESILTVYEKEDYLDGHKRILKGVPATYFSQVYKLLNGMKICDSDLVFMSQGELAKFIYPLKLFKQ